MLLNTIEQVRKHIAVPINNKFDSIAPEVKQAEKQLIKLLNSKLYQVLVTKQAAGTLSEKELDVVTLCQGILANRAYSSYIPIGQLDISESGIRIITDSQYKTAFQWQIDDLKEAFDQKVDTLEEELLAFLEENRDSFPLWRDSAASTILRQYYVNTLAEFQQYYSLSDSRRLFLSYRPIMQATEDLDVEQLLSEAFHRELKTQIQKGTLSEKNRLLVEKIRPVVVYMTIYRAMEAKAAELAAAGLVQQEYAAGSGNNRVRKTAAEAAQIRKAQSTYSIASRYIDKLTRFLSANADDYPLWRDSGLYIPPMPTQFYDNSSDHIYAGI